MFVRLLDVLAGKIGDLGYKTTLTVHNGGGDVAITLHGDGRNARLLCCAHVIGPKCGRNVNNACALVGSHKISCNNAKGGCTGCYIREKLGIRFPNQVFASVVGYDFPRDGRAAGLILLKSNRIHGCLCWKVTLHHGLGQNDLYRLVGVGVKSANFYVVDVFAYCQGAVRGQCPRGSGPGQEVVLLRVCYPKLCHDRGVLDLLITAWLVEFVGTQARASGRRVGLNSVAFVKQSLLMQLLEQVPE